MIAFDERRLLAAASQQLAVDEVLEPVFLPAFRALLTGLREEAQLGSVGCWRVGARLMTALGQRVALAQFERETPELNDLDIIAPIFITGLPRSSTRLLHNLLARLPGTWAPRLWELQRPVPPARIDERFIDRQIRTTEVLLEQLHDAAPELRHLQPQSPTAPDACSWLFRNNFSSLAHAFAWYMPSYVEFMLGAEPSLPREGGGSGQAADGEGGQGPWTPSRSLIPAYRDHRRFVRVLAHRHRHDDLAGPRIVLEDRWHLWHLDALFAAYPDAWVLRVSAPREQTLDELARCCWALQRVDARRPRGPRLIRDYCEVMLDAGLAAERRVRDERTTRILDIDAAELHDDPLALVTRLAPRLQLHGSTATLADASRWWSDQRALEQRPRGRDRDAPSVSAIG